MVASSGGGEGGEGGTDYTVLLVFAGPSLDRFWMARHRDRGWELPGGRVEADESLAEAARREWDEEVGLPLARLDPVLLQLRPNGDRGHVFVGHSVDARAPGALPDPKISEVVAVERIDDVSPLAFPCDPYAALAARLVERGLRWHDDGGPWPDEERAAAWVPAASAGSNPSTSDGSDVRGRAVPHPDDPHRTGQEAT